MYRDPIVAEIHRTREQHCQQFHGDLHQLFADVKQREQQHPEKVVNLRATPPPSCQEMRLSCPRLDEPLALKRQPDGHGA